MSRRALSLIGLVLISSLVLLWSVRVAAQSGTVVRLSEPETSQFPNVIVYLAVVDSRGRRVSGLSADRFQVLEGEQSILPNGIEEVQVGIRQVVALNNIPGLAVRDSRGVTRFERAREALVEAWKQPSLGVVGTEDLSLLLGDGARVEHSPTLSLLASTLDGLNPEFTEDPTGVGILSNALDFMDQGGEGIEKSNQILFLTSLPPTISPATLDNITQRAQLTGTLIYTVLFAPPEILETPEIEPLRELSASTGGELVLFDPEQGLGDLILRLFSQRTQYRLTYSSMIREPGTHDLQVQVTLDGEAIPSNPQSFNLDLQPPNVTFVQPPSTIVRTSEDPSVDLESLPPRDWEIRVLIDFPDGHERPIQSSELRVDGEVVQAREQGPFDQYRWDLSGYQESGDHELILRVEDSLGLRGSTDPHRVFVNVAPPPRGLAALRPAMGSLVAVAAVILAGVIMAIALLTLGKRGDGARGVAESAESRVNPVRRATLQAAPSERAEAHLIPQDPKGKPIPLYGMDVLLGRDASLSEVVVDDPSVEGMHARLIRQADGGYLLRDQDSVAGTWVNYELVGEGGRRLAHGDLINIGRVAFRFDDAQGDEDVQVRVYPVEDTPSAPQ